MNGILFIGHGSRDAEGNEHLQQFTQRVTGLLKEQTEVTLYETCFLELTRPTIMQGVQKIVERGATTVAMVPLMLFQAAHAKLHIPHEIDEAKAKYPHVNFHYGRPIGVHEDMVQILRDRLQNTTSYTPLEQANKDSAILLVGRGSSDSDANSDLCKIARLLWESTGVGNVEVAYMGVTYPTVEEGLVRCVKQGAKQIYVLPYLLFTGILLKRLEENLQQFHQDFPDINASMSEALGFHELLEQIVADRSVEALQGRALANCDLCQFRKLAVFDHHHDHDHDHDHHDHSHDHEHHHDHDHNHSHHHCDHDHKHEDEHDHGHAHTSETKNEPTSCSKESQATQADDKRGVRV